MTTITERIEYASAASHDFADAATDQIFSLANVTNPVNDEDVFKEHSALIAAMIDAAAKVYAAERQYEAAERIADGLMEIADALKRTKP